MLKTRHDGYVMIDHRASPGIPAAKALQMGFHPAQVAEGKVFEAATLGCPHCGSHVILNPLRTRARGHCHKCDRYICDSCAVTAAQADYVHITANQIADMVVGGRFDLSGSMSNPVLTRKELSHG